MDFWWWQVSKNGDGSMGEWISEDQWIIFNGHLEGARIEERRWNRSKMGFYALWRLRK